MSVLTYGPVRMQIQQTEHFSFGPAQSEDGVDYNVTALDLGVTAIVNADALATLGDGIVAGPPLGFGPPNLEDSPAHAGGDPMAVTLRRLRALLLAPRQALTFSIGGDTVVSIPAGGDAKNGPIPQLDTCVRWISGVMTARIYFHVKAWVVEFVQQGSKLATLPHAVLSNRYRVTSIMDEDFYTRRHVAGQMVVDPSALRNAVYQALGVFSPDSFRGAAFLSIPLGFQRQNVQVTVSSDNTTLDYSYVDQETPLALGLRSLATEIEGSFSGCIESPLSGLRGAQGVRAAIAAAIATGFGVTNWGWDMGSRFREWMGRGKPTSQMPDIGGWAAQIASGMSLPRILGSGTVRITGQRAATKDQLALLGINILLDRFTSNNNFGAYFAPGNLPRFGTVTVTQDLKHRFVEVAATFIPTYITQLAAAAGNLGTQAAALMNMGTDVNGQGAAGTAPLLTGSIAGVNPPPPNSGGTRGGWAGALLVALLTTPGNAPVLPPDPVVNVDMPGMV